MKATFSQLSQLAPWENVCYGSYDHQNEKKKNFTATRKPVPGII